MNSRAPVVSLVGVSRSFINGRVVVHALTDVSLEVFPGELLVIVGPSGSGKSTLLNVLGGIDRPSAGSVVFDDVDLARCSDAELTRFRREHVGFVFQFYNLIPTLTALENIEIAAELAAEPITPSKALQMVGLRDRARHFPAELSGGEQQRVAIARAIASNPELLLCDEPTGALDLATSRHVLGVLLELRRTLGKSVILITHNNAIARLADRVVEIRDGKIARVSPPTHPLSIEALQW